MAFGLAVDAALKTYSVSGFDLATSWLDPPAEFERSQNESLNILQWIYTGNYRQCIIMNFSVNNLQFLLRLYSAQDSAHCYPAHGQLHKEYWTKSFASKYNRIGISGWKWINLVNFLLHQEATPDCKGIRQPWYWLVTETHYYYDLVIVPVHVGFWVNTIAGWP